jgi:hypothetical protein
MNSLRRIPGKRLGRGWFGWLISGLGMVGLIQPALAREDGFEPEPVVPDPRFEITPFVGYAGGGDFEDGNTGEDRDIEEDSSFGIVLNANASPGRQYELLYSRQSTELAATAIAPALDLNVEYLHIGGIVTLDYDAKYVVPYFSGTLGATRFSADGPGTDSDVRFSFAFGAGLKIPVTNRFAVRLDARGFVTILNEASNILCVSNPSVASGCAIRTSGDTLIQFQGFAGVSVGF